jgi:hypothetical protein
LVERVIEAYRLACKQYRSSASGWDRDFVKIKREIHEALLRGHIEEVGRLLRNPAETSLFWGFDAIAEAPPGLVEPHEAVIRTLNPQDDWRRLYAFWLSDALNSLAEALGAQRVFYVEAQSGTFGARGPDIETTDETIDRLDAILGIRLQFPNPFPGELGLPSRRGVIGFRAIQAVYQAYRIGQITKGKPDARVLEIGAGLGRTAYYASFFGIKDYTILDIPLTNAAQGYFLGRVLGPGAIRLNGERTGGPLQILQSTSIEESAERYDLIVNVDSWTEMSPEVAYAYWEYARSATRTVLSINHEYNPLTVRAMYIGDPDVRAVRYPYWVRRGYVEEIITW